MQVGVVFPHSEIRPDAESVRAYGQGVEALGYGHLLAYDHVLGADPDVHVGWNGPYDVRTMFPEPMVMFGFLAAVTTLELATSVMVLPQRQTALVAKQAAQLDLLTNGRFRLGVGVGWNAVEYQALGKAFSTRGRRLDEQVELLRRLWTDTTVTFDGAHDKVDGAGICPLPIQRPIPVWFGGSSPAAYGRVGRLGDGWFPQIAPGAELDEAKKAVHEAALSVGRDPESIGMEGLVRWKGSVEKLIDHVERWRLSGATRVAVNTMGAGCVSVDDHLAALESCAEGLGLKRLAAGR